ncbi:MAG: hypothetical protein HQL52_01850 [Magnetococcales bacterium]|nr:hypothetical protein [Magnetococcales bacterium]
MKRQTPQQGSLIIVAIIVMVVVATIGISISKMYVGGAKTSVEVVEGSNSFDAAESGAQIVIGQLLANDCDPNTLSGAVVNGDGSVDVTQTISGMGEFTVTFTPTPAGQTDIYTAYSQGIGQRITQVEVSCAGSDSGAHPIMVEDPANLTIHATVTINDNTVIDCEAEEGGDEEGGEEGGSGGGASDGGGASEGGESEGGTSGGGSAAGLPPLMDTLFVELLPDFFNALISDARADDSGGGGSEGEEETTICHQPGTPAEQTMTVNASALDGHLGHGDEVGECSEGDSGGGGSEGEASGGGSSSSNAYIGTCNILTESGPLEEETIDFDSLGSYPGSATDGDVTISDSDDGGGSGGGASEGGESGGGSAVSLWPLKKNVLANRISTVFDLLISDARAEESGGGGSEGEEETTICHQPGTPAEQTMTVNASALDGHLGHGDELGECSEGDSGGGGSEGEEEVEESSNILPPGDYGTVTVEANQTVILQPGVYYIEELILADGAILQISPSGTVTLHTQSATFGTDTLVNSSGDAEDLLIYTYLTPGSVDIGDYSITKAIILAPDNGTDVTMGTGVEFTGAVASGGSVTIGENSALTFNDDIATVLETLGYAGDSSAGGAIEAGSWKETF